MVTANYTIDLDNNIRVFMPADEQPKGVYDIEFSNEQELENALASEGSLGRMVEVWNSFAGVAPFDELKPVVKFTDRKTGAKRIWKAIQRLAISALQEKPAGARKASKTHKASKQPNAAKKARTARPKADKAAPREGSKTEMILALLRRKDGATLPEIMKAADWQAHSVRGFIAGTVGKKLGLSVTSTKPEGGERTYKLA